MSHIGEGKKRGDNGMTPITHFFEYLPVKNIKISTQRE